MKINQILESRRFVLPSLRTGMAQVNDISDPTIYSIGQKGEGEDKSGRRTVTCGLGIGEAEHRGRVELRTWGSVRARTCATPWLRMAIELTSNTDFLIGGHYLKPEYKFCQRRGLLSTANTETNDTNGRES